MKRRFAINTNLTCDIVCLVWFSVIDVILSVIQVQEVLRKSEVAPGSEEEAAGFSQTNMSNHKC